MDGCCGAGGFSRAVSDGGRYDAAETRHPGAGAVGTDVPGGGRRVLSDPESKAQRDVPGEEDLHDGFLRYSDPGCCRIYDEYALCRHFAMYSSCLVPRGSLGIERLYLWKYEFPGSCSDHGGASGDLRRSDGERMRALTLPKPQT